jgi:hypothetical protein
MADPTGMAGRIAGVVRAVLRLAGATLRGVITLALALVLLFEEWGWRPLAELLSWLARFRPWARVEGWIAALPPYAALVVFALPSTVLLPVKLGALYLLSQGKVLLATAFLALAKVASTALVARIFLLTRPALMRLGWFARLYDWLMPWKEAIFARVRASWLWRYGRMLKARVRHRARQAWLEWRPLVVAFVRRWRPAVAAWVLALRIRAARLWLRLRRLFRD